MRIIFLASARPDLLWYTEYYQNVFPQGGRNPKRRYLKAKSLLRAFPEMGHPSIEEGTQELAIPGTPFMFVYRIAGGQIEIVRLWDRRSKQPNRWSQDRKPTRT